MGPPGGCLYTLATYAELYESVELFPKHENPNLIPIGDGFGFLLYFLIPFSIPQIPVCPRYSQKVSVFQGAGSGQGLLFHVWEYPSCSLFDVVSF